jgi:hypothetical protein
MTKLIFPTFLLTAYTQNLLWVVNVTLNSYKWLPWDIETGLMVYYSVDKEYKCNTFSRTCQFRYPNYIPNTYAIETTELFYYTEESSRKTCKSSNSNTRCETLYPSETYREFDSIVVNGDILFYGTPDSNDTMTIYDWTTSTVSRNKVKVSGVRYQVKDSLYSFLLNNDKTRIMKYSTDVTTIMWTTNLPYCRPDSVDTQLFVSTWKPFVYVVCTSANLLYKISVDQGSILDQMQLDKGDIMYVQTSYEYIFILFEDASVVQYTTDFNYVYTYQVPNTKLPKYVSLKTDKNFLFAVLCTSGSQECVSPAIFQWSIVKQTPRPVIKYTSTSTQGLPTIEKLSSWIDYKAITFSSYYLDNSGFSENHDFFPVTYMDSYNQYHLVYFSGGGNIYKGTCGDVFLHDTIVNELVTPGIPRLKNSTHYQWSLISNVPSYPLRSYAAILFPQGQTALYIIHGGVSCDYKKVYSDMFAIDILAKTYKKIIQEDAVE